jgi:hypothetical protein
MRWIRCGRCCTGTGQISALVDAELTVLLSRCPSITRGRLASVVDHVVANVDRDAVRRATTAGFPSDTETIDDLTALTRLQVFKASILNFPFLGPLNRLWQGVSAGVDRAISSRS